MTEMCLLFCFQNFRLLFPKKFPHNVRVPTVQHVKEKLQKLDDDYSELEEKYREAKGKIDDGTNKYIPQTKDGQQFTNDIRTLYYRLLAEQIPPIKIEKSVRIREYVPSNRC